MDEKFIEKFYEDLEELRLSYQKFVVKLDKKKKLKSRKVVPPNFYKSKTQRLI